MCVLYDTDFEWFQGLIPNPEEERDLEELNRPLLASVNTSMDRNFTDPNPPMGILIQYSKFFYYVYSNKFHCLEEFPFLFPPLEKRDVTGKVICKCFMS